MFRVEAEAAALERLRQVRLACSMSMADAVNTGLNGKRLVVLAMATAMKAEDIPVRINVRPSSVLVILQWLQARGMVKLGTA